MPYCSCNQIELYYEIYGSGFPVLFISGLGGGSWSWKKQVSYFSSNYQTIVFDNRGAGQSSKPEGPYTMEMLALDAVHLLHSLQVQEVFVIGISMGGMIAQELSLLLPHRVRALVLGCTHPGGKLQVLANKEVYRKLTHNEGLSKEELIEKNISLLFSKNCIENHPEIIEEFKKEMLDLPMQPAHAFQAQMSAIQNFDCSDRLSKIQVPTLVLTGTDDILVPPENSHILADQIPNASLEAFSGVGHVIHLEDTQRFNELIDSFFQRHLP